jgi:hypothetical protein
MKAKLFLLLFACAALMACEKHRSPSDDYVPDTQLAIIRLPYGTQNKVLVSPIVDSVIVNPSNNSVTLYYGNGGAMCNATKQDSLLAQFAQDQLKILGTNPYIILDNGYVIIDWKWIHFHPLSGALRYAAFSSSLPYHLFGYSTNPYRFYPITNEEYYLLPFIWQEIVDLTQQWIRDECEHIERPEVRYANLIDIEKYGNYSTGCRDISLKYNVTLNDLHAIYNLHIKDESMFTAFVYEYDRLQAAYVETLNQMIRNNDFEKWTLYKKTD